MSEFKKLDDFMRTHAPLATAAPVLRRKPRRLLAWASIATACLCLGLYQLQRTEATNTEVIAAMEVLEWDLSQEEAYSEITELVALVD